jgi:hypothetical protein
MVALDPSILEDAEVHAGIDCHLVGVRLNGHGARRWVVLWWENTER